MKKLCLVLLSLFCLSSCGEKQDKSNNDTDLIFNTKNLIPVIQCGNYYSESTGYDRLVVKSSIDNMDIYAVYSGYTDLMDKYLEPDKTGQPNFTIKNAYGSNDCNAIPLGIAYFRKRLYFDKENEILISQYEITPSKNDSASKKVFKRT